MNPQLLRAIAVERMDEIAREAEQRRRTAPVRPTVSMAARNGHHRDRWPSVRASIRRLQPGS